MEAQATARYCLALLAVVSGVPILLPLFQAHLPLIKKSKHINLKIVRQLQTYSLLIYPIEVFEYEYDFVH